MARRTARRREAEAQPSARAFGGRGGLLAVVPSALGILIEPAWEAPASTLTSDAIAIVPVEGPLSHHAESGVDCYDAIRARVACSIADGARTVVLAIDSPGGYVSGCFALARDLRALADESGVQLVTHVSGQACSAAYALACASDRIYAEGTALVGSIGVIDALIDETERDAFWGTRWTLITSGQRKGDGNPHAETSDGAVAAAQARVMEMAEIFFAHVAERRGIAPDALRAMEAGVYLAGPGIGAGLVDEVATLDQVLASVRSGAVQTAQKQEENKPMDDETQSDEAARAALQAIVDDEKKSDAARARARAALAALEGEDDERKDEEPAAEAEEAPTEDDEKTDDEKTDDEVPAAQAAASLAARVASLEAAQARKARAELRASRPDVAKSVHDALEALPLAQHRAALRGIERPRRPSPAAATTPAATRAEGQSGVSAPRLPPAEKAALDRRMGVVKPVFGVVNTAYKQTFGAVTNGANGANNG